RASLSRVFVVRRVAPAEGGAARPPGTGSATGARVRASARWGGLRARCEGARPLAETGLVPYPRGTRGEMTPKIQIGLMSLPLIAVALYFALVYFGPPMPGDQPSPKLV